MKHIPLKYVSCEHLITPCQNKPYQLFHNVDVMCSTSGSNSTESDGLPVHLLNATNKVQYAANTLSDILKMIFLNFPLLLCGLHDKNRVR